MLKKSYETQREKEEKEGERERGKTVVFANSGSKEDEEGLHQRP